MVVSTVKQPSLCGPILGSPFFKFI